MATYVCHIKVIGGHNGGTRRAITRWPLSSPCDRMHLTNCSRQHSATAQYRPRLGQLGALIVTVAEQQRLEDKGCRQMIPSCSRTLFGRVSTAVQIFRASKGEKDYLQRTFLDDMACVEESVLYSTYLFFSCHPSWSRAQAQLNHMASCTVFTQHGSSGTRMSYIEGGIWHPRGEFPILIS